MAFAGDASLTDVAIEDAGLVRVKVGAAEGVATQELKRVPFSSLITRDAAAMRAALEEVLRGEGRDIRVLVSPDHVLRKRVVLPMATEENLLDVVGFDMDRQTPFTAAQVYFGARVVARDVAHERLEVEVVAVPKNTIEPWLIEMRAAAISVHSIVAADEFTVGAKRGVAPIELLAASAGPARRWSNMQRINVGLIALGLLMALAAVLLPIWQKRETVKALMPLSVKADAEFKITQRVTEEYTRLANEYNYVVGRKHANYPTVMLVDEITKISPDTMWIQSFEYKTLAKARELQLAGEAASVSKVIESLEQTPFLQNTVQRQQTRPGSRPNIEYFTLASEVKSRPLPEAISTDVASAVSAAQPKQDASLVVAIPPPIAAIPAVPTAPITPLKTAPASQGSLGVPPTGVLPPASATASPMPVPALAPAPVPVRTPAPAVRSGNSPTPIPFPPLQQQSAPLMPMPANAGSPSVPTPLPPEKARTP